jgi:hypothetical protein
MAVGKGAMDIFFYRGEHVFGVVGQLIEELLVVAGVFQFAVVGLGRYHEKEFEVLLFDEQGLVETGYFGQAPLREVLFLVAQQFQVLG